MLSRPDLPKRLTGRIGGTVRRLTIDNVITYGDTGCVNGIIEFGRGKQLRFCDVHEFTGHGKTAKIRRVTSYWIEVN